MIDLHKFSISTLILVIGVQSDRSRVPSHQGHHVQTPQPAQIIGVQSDRSRVPNHQGHHVQTPQPAQTPRPGCDGSQDCHVQTRQTTSRAPPTRQTPVQHDNPTESTTTEDTTTKETTPKETTTVTTLPLTCDAGYTIKSESCEENVCTCTNGSGATNTACATDDTEVCATCDTGHNLSGGFCFENVCTCDNGSGATNTACATNSDAVCAACDVGYTLDNDSCRNTCELITCSSRDEQPNTCNLAGPAFSISIEIQHSSQASACILSQSYWLEEGNAAVLHVDEGCRAKFLYCY